MDEKIHVVDINRTADVLAPETGVKGGLSLPNKERPLFRIQEKKSVLGLDVLARAKKASKGVEEFKVPSERTISAVTSLDEDEKSSSYGSEDFGSKSSFSVHSHASRRYRGTIVEEKSQLSSELTNEVTGGYASRTEVSIESASREVLESSNHLDRGAMLSLTEKSHENSPTLPSLIVACIAIALEEDR